MEGEAKKGVTAKFESAQEGRKAFFAALADPAFIKATDEMMSLLFPHGTCIHPECIHDQKREYEKATREQRWRAVTPKDETPRSCVQCGTADETTIFGSTFLLYVRLCRTCYDNDDWKKVILF
jgi:hypothetical protein